MSLSDTDPAQPDARTVAVVSTASGPGLLPARDAALVETTLDGGKPASEKQAAIPSEEPANSGPPLTASKAVEIAWESAWEALVLAFLIQILGGVVLSIAGSIWRDMTPSLPPGVTNPASLIPRSASSWASGLLSEHRFLLCFSFLFAAKCLPRLLSHSRDENHRAAASRFQRITDRLSNEWFGLVVGNAFTAFVAVLVVKVTQQFSITQILWHVFSGLLRPVLDALAGLLPGGTTGAAIKSWSGWYQANQFKFLFWLFYSAAICDDLGLPNYKTLCRWFWRRIKRRARPAPSRAKSA